MVPQQFVCLSYSPVTFMIMAFLLYDLLKHMCTEEKSQLLSYGGQLVWQIS